jgi:hypothetical protein
LHFGAAKLRPDQHHFSKAHAFGQGNLDEKWCWSRSPPVAFLETNFPFRLVSQVGRIQRMHTNQSHVDISGLDPALVLAGLWNAAAPNCPGGDCYNQCMTIEDAKRILEDQKGFDYHEGRPLKFDIGDPNVYVLGYDHYHGSGAFQRVIEALRSDPNPISDAITRLFWRSQEHIQYVIVGFDG